MATSPALEKRASNLLLCVEDPTIQKCLANRDFIEKQTVYKVSSLRNVIELIYLIQDEQIPAYNWEPEKEVSLFFLKGEIFKRIGVPPSTRPITAEHLIQYLSLEQNKK